MTSDAKPKARGREPFSLERLPRARVALALGLAVLAVLLLYLEPLDALYGTDNAADALGVALVLAATLPLALVSVAPLRALTTVVGSSGGAILLGYPATTTIASSLLAIGLAAYETDRRTSFCIAILAGATVAAAITDPGIGPSPVINALFGAVIGAVPALIGDALRTQAALAASMRRNALDLQRLNATETRQAVIEERVRIARDVHDTVGHHLAAIAVQANAGSRRTGDPIEVGKVLETIRQQSSEALLQTRQNLGLLREDEAVRSSALGLGDVDSLLETTRRAGVRVTASVEGTVRTIPRAVDTTCYRILQEALTNVSKHARPARAEVHIVYEAQSVRLLVDDDGRTSGGPTAPGQGNGLIGMRERVALLHGELSAGTRAGGGWRVAAALPTVIAR